MAEPKVKLQKEYSIEEGKRVVQYLYSSIESKVKSLCPENFAIYASQQLQIAIKRNQITRVRPHHTFHAIEACCAYSRGRPRRMPQWKDLAKIMNTYHEHKSPLQFGYLAQNRFSLFILLMQREQFDVQYSQCLNDISRTWRIFVLSSELPNLQRRFELNHQISIREWILLCVFCSYLAQGYQPFTKQQLVDTISWIVEPEKVAIFLAESSKTTAKIGAEFKSVREQLRNATFHAVIKTQFLQHPMIELESNTYFVPKHDFLTLHAALGIYLRVRQWPEFSEEFGVAFEDYVLEIANLCKPKRTMRDHELEAVLQGRHCDLLLEFDDYVLLIECKAVTFTPKFLTELTVRNDNSTSKICDGIEQLSNTRRQIERGGLENDGIDRNKRIECFVITYGSIPFVNSDWHYNEIVLRSLQASNRQFVVETIQSWTNRPTMLQVDSWEKIALLLSTKEATVPDLIAKKSLENYLTDGDWDVFLNRTLNNSGTDHRNPILESAWDDFSKSFGLSNQPE